jgi:hypothetical protein
MDTTYELTEVKLRINKVLNNMIVDKNCSRDIYDEVLSIGNKIGRICNNKR